MDRKKLFSLIKNILFIIIFIGLIEYIGFARSIIAYLGFILLMAGVRLVRNKEMYVNAIKSVEAVMFGKALDRDLWKKGELKRRKIKVVWKAPAGSKGVVKNESGK